MKLSKLLSLNILKQKEVTYYLHLYYGSQKETKIYAPTLSDVIGDFYKWYLREGYKYINFNNLHFKIQAWLSVFGPGHFDSFQINQIGLLGYMDKRKAHPIFLDTQQIHSPGQSGVIVQLNIVEK